jgi:hypothetical protein
MCAETASRGLDREAVGTNRRAVELDGRQDRYLRESEEDVSTKRLISRGAVDALGPFIASLRPWDCFFTGTYSPRKRNGAVECILGVDVAPRVSRWKALRDGARLVEWASELVGAPTGAVIAVEPHLDRSYHLHGLLDLLGASRAHLEALKWQWEWTYGFCHFDRPRGMEEVCRYSAKYLVGPECDVWFSPGLEPVGPVA